MVFELSFNVCSLLLTFKQSLTYSFSACVSVTYSLSFSFLLKFGNHAACLNQHITKNGTKMNIRKPIFLPGPFYLDGKCWLLLRFAKLNFVLIDVMFKFWFSFLLLWLLLFLNRILPFRLCFSFIKLKLLLIQH